MRASIQTATIENGFVYLPYEAPWLGDYEHELAIFPAGRRDDQVDSMVQILTWFNQRPIEPASLGYYRRRPAGASAKLNGNGRCQAT